MAYIFRRVEEKYVLNKEQLKKIKEVLKEYMIPDVHGKSTICNIYFDSDQYDLGRRTISKPIFKEKIRLRSYNIPTQDSMVYLEIKRKCDGVVGKRRIGMKLSEFNEYLKNPKSLQNTNAQIKKELDYCFKFYGLKPTMYLSYEREAYYDKENVDFRITFDNNIIAREKELDLEKGSFGKSIFDKDKYIMEVKTLGAMPIWFVKVINELKLKPFSFSKYGEAYKRFILNQEQFSNKRTAAPISYKEIDKEVKRNMVGKTIPASA